MLLKHNKYPNAEINLPTGGSLVFRNFECVVVKETLELVGPEFFNGLINRGTVTLTGRKTVEEYLYEDQEMPTVAKEDGDDVHPQKVEKDKKKEDKKKEDKKKNENKNK